MLGYSMMGKRVIGVCTALLLAVAPAAIGAERAKDEKSAAAEVKEAGREVGHAARDGGKAVGRGAATAGKGIAKGAKTAGKEIGKGARQIGHGVRDAFRDD